MKDFQEAWCIELYDAMCYIQGEHDASGTMEYGAFPLAWIDGRMLAQVFEHLGLELQYGTENHNGKDRHVQLKDREFKIMRLMNQYGEYSPVVKIEAKIESDPDLLHIRVHEKVQGDEIWVDHLTYSGKYLVHWAPPKGDEHESRNEDSHEDQQESPVRSP